MFDSSMVNKPLGFEPLKFYCVVLSFISGTLKLIRPIRRFQLRGYQVNSFLILKWSVLYLTTLFLSRLSLLRNLPVRVHILSLDTDN